MKGLVFTTFFSFCEEKRGADFLDDVIDAAHLPHDGVYTSVGTYPFQEMVALITGAVKISGSTMPVMMDAFGQYCFACWVKKFPATFDGKALFDVLSRINEFHENEVRLLYPDAELPSFDVVHRDDQCLTLHYRSCKPLADLAVGVIQGAADHMHTPVHVSYKSVGDVIHFDVRCINKRLAA